MPLTDDQQQTLILSEIGKTGDADAITLVSLLWTKYEDQPAIDPRLRALFVKRDAIIALIGQNAAAVLVWKEADASQDNSGYIQALQKLLDVVNAQLAQIQGAGAAAVGVLTATAPITDTCGVIDPNARVYRGDPLQRFPWPR